MKHILILTAAALTLTACAEPGGNDADQRQAAATKQALDSADREIGMPRMVNYAQRKLLKNAYEDMDQTTLTYVYVQAMNGQFLCLGQAVGYGVSLGTQFTAPYTLVGGYQDSYGQKPQAEPNGLFMPESGAATIVNLIDSETGIARTSLVEPNVVTTPNKLPASVVSVPCPAPVDPKAVKDAKETSAVKQRD